MALEDLQDQEKIIAALERMKVRMSEEIRELGFERSDSKMYKHFYGAATDTPRRIAKHLARNPKNYEGQSWVNDFKDWTRDHIRERDLEDNLPLNWFKLQRMVINRGCIILCEEMGIKPEDLGIVMTGQAIVR